MEHFWNRIYRLKCIKRWSTSVSIESETVAEHCYYVAILANILATIDSTVNGTDVNMTNILVQALYHDAFECYTSHIVSPIKHHNENIFCSMEQLKDSYTHRLFNLLPNEYSSTINCGKNKQQDYRYIEIADSIEAYTYCAFQVHLGNQDFNHKFGIMKANISLLIEKYNFVKIFFDEFFDESEFEINY